MTTAETERAAATAPDPDKLLTMALRVWGYKQGEVVSLTIHLGDRLGLYAAMQAAGPVTAAGLASRTGLHPQWLRGQVAAGLVDSADGEVFQLSPEGAALLADEDTSVWFAAGAFHGCAATAQTVERLAESFRTGGAAAASPCARSPPRSPALAVRWLRPVPHCDRAGRAQPGQP